MTLAPDFDEFCALLTDHGVEFVIVGAHAHTGLPDGSVLLHYEVNTATSRDI